MELFKVISVSWTAANKHNAKQINSNLSLTWTVSFTPSAKIFFPRSFQIKKPVFGLVFLFGRRPLRRGFRSLRSLGVLQGTCGSPAHAPSLPERKARVSIFTFFQNKKNRWRLQSDCGVKSVGGKPRAASSRIKQESSRETAPNSIAIFSFSL